MAAQFDVGDMVGLNAHAIVTVNLNSIGVIRSITEVCGEDAYYVAFNPEDEGGELCWEDEICRVIKETW